VALYKLADMFMSKDLVDAGQIPKFTIHHLTYSTIFGTDFKAGTAMPVLSHVHIFDMTVRIMLKYR